MPGTKDEASATYQKLKETVAAIEKRTKIRPKVGLVLGSGLGPVAELITNVTTIPYAEIPHFFPTAVEGHSGELVLGQFGDVPVVCLRGRFHFYEGYSMDEVIFPTRVLCALGIQLLLLTNAAGGVNTRYRPGDLMLIEDHLNLSGGLPLRGPNLSKLGPRFPDMTEAYNKKCLEIMKTSASKAGVEVHTGVYVGLPGPAYETPAEVRMLRTLGADATGMSTVTECIAANHLGVQVAGISCITNQAAGLSPHALTHQEVIEVSRLGATKMKRLLEEAMPRFNEVLPLFPERKSDAF